ncbi:MAG: SsrA-binding protein [Chlamydiales bacterium]|nr:SsrA-binding protein [Chlamydiales bacterium]MCH9620186.1 SsrA-binding protein [Chlamydiales bacterium]MCH9623099.1 SsrA-binding protein [Chlamydiales bacterium]
MTKELVSNRKAYHDYEILETFEAGVVLLGTEVKSLRASGGSLQEGYIRILKGELWLIGAHIAAYRFGNLHNHEERRDRKLLVHKRELERLEAKIREKGMTLVPLSLYLKNGRVKCKFGTAKGRKKHDKRAAMVEREKKREMDRAMKRPQ